MKTKIFSCVMILLLVLTFSSCTYTINNYEEKQPEPELLKDSNIHDRSFVYITTFEVEGGPIINISYYYEVGTEVVYTFVQSDGMNSRTAGFSPMMNADGTCVTLSQLRGET